MHPRYLAIALTIGICVLVGGCHEGHRTGEGALIGGGAGAGAGAIAAAAGASPWWILGGAAIGAVGGAIIGHEMDADSKRESLQDHMATCHYQHFQCIHCGCVFCNRSQCPNCGAIEWRQYP